MLAHVFFKRLRKILETSAISLLSSVNLRPGFFNLYPFLGKLILNSYNIWNFNFSLFTYLYFFVSMNLNFCSLTQPHEQYLHIHFLFFSSVFKEIF